MSLDSYDLKTLSMEAQIIGNKLDIISDRQKETNNLLRHMLSELLKLNGTVKSEPWTVVKE